MAHSGKTMTFATDLVPQEDNIYSLGTDSLKWIIRGSLPLSDITGADDLKAIEAISGTTGLLKKTAANTWTLDTNTYLTSHRTYTAFTGKPTTNQTPGFGSTFTIQQISQNTSGQVSGTDRTVKIPDTAASATTVGLVNTDAQTFAGVKTFDNGIHVYGTISTQGTGSVAGTMYPGGAYHSGHNSIVLHGDTAGVSGIGFTSEKATKAGTTTNINGSSDRAFIQYHAYGVTAAAEGTAPTLATSGELGTLVIGVGNDATDTIRLQAPGTAGILHQIGATAYPIPHTTNTNGSVGGTTTPVYVDAGVIKAGTALGTASQKAESYFVKAITSTDNAIVRFNGTSGQAQNSGVTIDDNNNIFTSGQLQTGRYFHNVAYLASTGTPKEILIKTKLPFTNGTAMPKIFFHIYNYTSSKPTELSLGFYIYNGVFTNYGATSNTSHRPIITLSTYTENSNTYVAIGLGLIGTQEYTDAYYVRFNVDLLDEWNGRTSTAYALGWTVEQNTTTTSIIPTDNRVTLSYVDQAQTAKQAGITSTKFGLAYYSDTVGTFASTAVGTSGQYLKSNGTSAPTWATFSASTVGLGNVENTKLSTWAGSSNITTVGTISTGTWHGTKIANDYIANPKVTIAGNEVSLGGSLAASTLTESLGLSKAMHFIGIATNTITDGGTQDPGISGYSTKTAGDVIIDSASSREYVWSTTGKWELLGGDASYWVSSTDTAAKFWRGDNVWSDTISGGTLKIANHSITLEIGAQNGSWTHFTSNAAFYFNHQLNVVDGFKVYNTNTSLTNNNLTFAQGGGWSMSDSTWIRTVGSKSVYMNAGTFRNDGTTQLRSLVHINANTVDDGSWVTGVTGVAPTATTTNDTTTYSGATIGTSILTLGNNKIGGNSASGVANNSQGILRLYSSGSAYGELTGYTTGARTHIHASSGISLPENIIDIMFRPGSGSYYTHIAYETSGNEALVAATQNAVTSFIFVNGESYANVATDRWTKLTGASGAGNAPGLQIKQNCVSIGELIPSGTNATYKLKVAGTSYFTKPIISTLTPSSWIDGQRYANGAVSIADYSNTGSYNPWMRATNTWASGAENAKVGRWFSFGTLGTSFYWMGSVSTRTENSYDNALRYDTSNGYLYAAAFKGNADTATSAGKWTTARTLTIGNKGQSVDGSGNVSWSLADIGALASTTKYAASSSVGGAATNATTTANTSDSIYPVGVKSGATTTLLHDTSITMKGNAITAVTYNSTAASLTSETSTTANTAKYATLTLGNNANVSTTTAHSEGQIVMYSAATQAHTIKGTSTTTAYTHTLPNDTGLLVSLSGGTAKGSSTKPVYIPNTGIVTECSTYAGGTKVTFNGADKGASTASFYAPTTGGTAGHVLIGAGTTTAPAWYGGTVMTGTAAADWKTAFNGTTDATASNAAAVTIAGGLGIAKSIIVGEIATVADDILSPRFTLTVNGTDKAYLQYNATDDSIDFIFV